MIAGVTLKVCGLRTTGAAAAAARCGADWLGFNFHPDSPRYLSLAQFQALAPQLPKKPKVAVSVEPGAAELAAMQGAGFDAFQIHFRDTLPLERLAEWSRMTGPDRLWLAPRLQPDRDTAEEWLPLAGSFLLDTFQPDRFGGSGRVGDWGKFARHARAHPEKTWILAGGLNAENIGAALKETGARFVDVNSGVESAPGVKDPERIVAFAKAIEETAP